MNACAYSGKPIVILVNWSLEVYNPPEAKVRPARTLELRLAARTFPCCVSQQLKTPDLKRGRGDDCRTFPCCVSQQLKTPDLKRGRGDDCRTFPCCVSQQLKTPDLKRGRGDDCRTFPCCARGRGDSEPFLSAYTF